MFVVKNFIIQDMKLNLRDLLSQVFRDHLLGAGVIHDPLFTVLGTN